MYRFFGKKGVSEMSRLRDIQPLCLKVIGKEGSNLEHRSDTANAPSKFFRLSMGPRGLELLEFFLEGLGSNLWGFRCPVYCHQPDIPLLLLVFLIGGFSGAAATLWTLSRLYSTASSRRLALYEQ